MTHYDPICHTILGRCGSFCPLTTSRPISVFYDSVIKFKANYFGCTIQPPQAGSQRAPTRVMPPTPSLYSFFRHTVLQISQLHYHLLHYLPIYVVLRIAVIFFILLTSSKIPKSLLLLNYLACVLAVCHNNVFKHFYILLTIPHKIQCYLQQNLIYVLCNI